MGGFVLRDGDTVGGDVSKKWEIYLGEVGHIGEMTERESVCV